MAKQISMVQILRDADGDVEDVMVGDFLAEFSMLTQTSPRDATYHSLKLCISETKEVGGNQRTAVVCCKRSVRLGVLSIPIRVSSTN